VAVPPASTIPFIARKGSSGLPAIRPGAGPGMPRCPSDVRALHPAAAAWLDRIFCEGVGA
jgi:hypothetical protein